MKVKFLSEKSLQMKNIKILGYVLFSMNQNTFIDKLLIKKNTKYGANTFSVITAPL